MKIPQVEFSMSKIYKLFCVKCWRYENSTETAKLTTAKNSTKESALVLFDSLNNPLYPS